MIQEAVMFPGLGAGYSGMVARFCRRHPQAIAPIRDWALVTGLDLISEPPGERRERQRHRQLQVHVMNLLWWRMEAEKHPGAAVCGHSLGFYAALVAAGVIEEQFSVELVDKVFELSWDAWANNGYEVVAITSRQMLDDPQWLLDDYALEALCVNSDSQIVVYGAPGSIERLCRDLGDDLIGRNRLDSPIPFHSWTMRGVSSALERLMTRDHWRLGEPIRPLWSHIHARRIKDAAAAAYTLANQPRLPVLWRDTINDLRMCGTSRFVEIGPNRMLSQIARWIVPNLEVAYCDWLRFAQRARA